MELIQEGQKISINIFKDDKCIEIICKIKEVMSDRLSLELPPYFMRYVQLLDVGREFTAKVFSKFGTIDFNTIVISSPLENSEVFTIEFDYNAIKFTPGEELPVINAVEPISIKFNNTTIDAKTFEISTEYIKLYSDYQFAFEDSFDCELILPADYDTIKFRATVIEINPEYDKEYKVSFYSMNEHDRQTLLYYMYMYSNDSYEETDVNTDTDREQK